jgi:hypothetical protein
LDKYGGLREDDALFVEEEQNLFIDEVREVKLWSGVFQNLPQETLESTEARPSPLLLLAQWAIEGLLELHEIHKKDGPLGWTSSPAAFAIFMRISACTNTLLVTHSKYEKIEATNSDFHNTWASKIKEVQEKLELFLQQGSSRDIHQSLLASLSYYHSQSTTNGASPARPLFPLYLKGSQHPRGLPR